MATKRNNPPPPAVMLARQEFGQHIQDVLTKSGMSRKTLSYLLGYKNPKSAEQLVTGTNGPSQPVMDRLLLIFPELLQFPRPPVFRTTRASGAPGPHKKHDYPLGKQQRPPIVGRKGVWNG